MDKKNKDKENIKWLEKYIWKNGKIGVSENN